MTKIVRGKGFPEKAASFASPPTVGKNILLGISISFTLTSQQHTKTKNITSHSSLHFYRDATILRKKNVRTLFSFFLSPHQKENTASITRCCCSDKKSDVIITLSEGEKSVSRKYNRAVSVCYLMAFGLCNLRSVLFVKRGNSMFLDSLVVVK